METFFETHLDVLRRCGVEIQISKEQEERHNRIISQVHDFLDGILPNTRWCNQLFSSCLIFNIVTENFEFRDCPRNDELENKMEILCMLKRSDEVVMQGYSKGVSGKKVVLHEASRTWLMQLLEEDIVGSCWRESDSIESNIDMATSWHFNPQMMLDEYKNITEPIVSDYAHSLGTTMNEWNDVLTDCPVKRNGSRKAFCESEYERFVFCYDLAEAYELLPIDTSLNKKEKYDKVKSIMATFSRNHRK